VCLLLYGFIFVTPFEPIWTVLVVAALINAIVAAFLLFKRKRLLGLMFLLVTLMGLGAIVVELLRRSTSVS